MSTEELNAENAKIAADAKEAHKILSELCYNHDENATLTDLANRVRNIVVASTGCDH